MLKHIFNSCVEIKIRFLYISKYNIYIKKLISFYKIYINFPYLEETLKILKNLAWRIYSSPNIISYTTFIIDYLSKDINLIILILFYIVLSNSN